MAPVLILNKVEARDLGAEYIVQAMPYVRIIQSLLRITPPASVVFIFPILEKPAYMRRMYLANFLDFYILLNRVCLPETYVGVASESD